MTEASVRIAWWNPKLYAKAIGSLDVARARVVLRQLRDDLACAAVVLCEVAPELDSALVSSGERSARSGLDADDIVVGFDPAQIDVSFRRIVTTRIGGKAYRSGTLFDLQLPGGAAGVLAACHWRAEGNRGDQDDVRSSHSVSAVQLQRELFPEERALRAAHVLVLGDFNAEPFDPAMRVLGTRDLLRARRSDNLLYNLAWRWLGSLRPYRATEARGDAPAGTYLLRGGGVSRWRTFDQALVSASLVARGAWSLDEANSGPVLPSSLRGDRGALLHAAADHLPIILSLEYNPTDVPEVEHDDAG